MTTPTIVPPPPNPDILLTAPSLWAMAHGEGAGTLRQVVGAGIDPAAAFGAAFGLNKVVGMDSFNGWLQQKAAGPHPATPHGQEPGPVTDDATPPKGNPADDSAAEKSATGKPTDSDAGKSATRDAATDGPEKGAASKAATTDADTAGGSAAKAPAGESSTGTNGSAGKTAAAAGDKATKQTAEEAAQVAKRRLRQTFAEDGVKAAVKQGVTQAVSRGGALGSKLVAAQLLRLGTMSVPGLGVALTAALWAFDSSGRKAFNGLMERITGTVTPGLNAAPSPPRTMFLPLTNDGNRDPIIEAIDAQMVAVNNKSFGFDESLVWPLDGSGLTTATAFPEVSAGLAKLTNDLGATLSAITSVYQKDADERYVAMTWRSTQPGAEQLADMQATMIPALTAAVNAAAVAVNEAYQGFRGINKRNREAIANSNSGIFASIIGNHIRGTDMASGAEPMMAAVEKVRSLAPNLLAAVKNLSIAPSMRAPALTGPAAAAPATPTQPAPAAPTPGGGGSAAPWAPPFNPGPLPEVDAEDSDAAPAAVPDAPAPEGAGQANPPQQPQTPDPLAKDLASLLKTPPPGSGTGMPVQLPQIPTQIPNLMPQMPQMPTMPNFGAMTPPSTGLPPAARPTGLTANDLPDELKKRLEDTRTVGDKKDQPLGEAGKIKEKDLPTPGEPGKGKAPEALLNPAPATAPPGQESKSGQAGQARPGAAEHAASTTAGGDDKPGPHTAPSEENTVDVQGRKWTFDNPKLAALAQSLAASEGQHSLRQAASDAGFKLPPPGQDIGTEVPTSRLKPGDVIMGAHNQNAVFLGAGQDGQAQVLTERGEVKQLHEVAKFDGPHQGFFRLADDGNPAPQVQTVGDQAGGGTTQQHSSPPAASPTAGAAPPTPPPPTAPSAEAPQPPASPDSTQATHAGILPGQVTGKPGLDPRNVPPNR